jgi:two-component system OmpR family response regulator
VWSSRSPPASSRCSERARRARRRGVDARAQLLAEVWGSAFDGDPNIVDVYVGYARAKLAKLAEAAGPKARVPTIKAVRGVGFRLALDERKDDDGGAR